MRTRLDQIEARLQSFIESSLYLLPAAQRPALLVRQLVQALERTIVQQADGSLAASNVYTISIHPHHAAVWQSNPELLPALARVLHQAASDAGVNFFTPPNIELQPDAAQALDQFSITASSRSARLDQTGVLPVNTGESSAEDQRPPASFLIVGKQTIPLRLAVINIGRREDNQLVLSDTRISRVHAQLRAIHGQYTLFDLNSTGGTYINGVRISQQALKPGDVISLAGFPLIYGEEAAPGNRAVEDTLNQSLP